MNFASKFIDIPILLNSLDPAGICLHIVSLCNVPQPFLTRFILDVHFSTVSMQSMGLMWLSGTFSVAPVMLSWAEPGVIAVFELSRGRAVKQSWPAGKEGKGMIMRMIWGFLDENVCRDLRLMHASTSRHFPLLAQRNRRLGKMLERKEWWEFIFEGSGPYLCWCPT